MGYWLSRYNALPPNLKSPTSLRRVVAPRHLSHRQQGGRSLVGVGSRGRAQIGLGPSGGMGLSKMQGLRLWSCMD